ncbi:Na(+)/citrate cotransporter-like [Argopecten irradians]|uniref:Na(+)/citrate cotransporter-like n=1 Tax=Argopecten irradians TaxID=31199 RepID=UPI00371ABD27
MWLAGFVRDNKPLFLFLIPPVLLLPLVIIGNSQQSNCAYGLILMAFYWTTEALPVSITALLPVALFPIMGVGKVAPIASKYFNPTIFNLIGALTVAIAIERWGVHKRFALRFLLVFGTTPSWLILGFMLSTFTLSMWLLNIPTTAMMVPIAQAVLTKLLAPEFSQQTADKLSGTTAEITPMDGAVEVIDMLRVEINQERVTDSTTTVVRPTSAEAEEFNYEALDPESQRICKATMLGVCYAANCGGIAVLTGTAPNLVMKAHADMISDGQSGITFASWFIFSFPVALISVLLAWLCLQVVFLGPRSIFRPSAAVNSKKAKQCLREQYQQLGKLSFAEKAVLAHLVALVLAWFTIDPGFVPGWGSLFRKGYMGGAVPSILIASLLFVFPSSRRRNRDIDPSRRTLLDWDTLNRKFPWGVTLLMGGGFALAHTCKESGLSLWLANQMTGLVGVPNWALVSIVCLMVSLCTEVAGNTAICSIFMPILSDLGNAVGTNPVFFMLPAAITTSFAFMLPVATPPNTIAFSYGYLRIIDMVKVGWLINLLCVTVVSIAVNTLGMAYFHFDVLPEWAKLAEITSQNLTSTIYSIVNRTTPAF